LTVTGAYKDQNGEVFFNQMILDRVENDEYILQNTLHKGEIEESQRIPLLRIDRQKRYYDGFFHLYNNGDSITKPNGEFLLLTNEDCNSMNEGEWYLLPEAYSITLTSE
jgi:riboflavin synthase